MKDLGARGNNHDFGGSVRLSSKSEFRFLHASHDTAQPHKMQHYFLLSIPKIKRYSRITRIKFVSRDRVQEPINKARNEKETERKTRHRQSSITIYI